MLNRAKWNCSAKFFSLQTTGQKHQDVHWIHISFAKIVLEKNSNKSKVFNLISKLFRFWICNNLFLETFDFNFQKLNPYFKRLASIKYFILGITKCFICLGLFIFIFQYVKNMYITLSTRNGIFFNFSELSVGCKITVQDQLFPQF